MRLKLWLRLFVCMFFMSMNVYVWVCGLFMATFPNWIAVYLADVLIQYKSWPRNAHNFLINFRRCGKGHFTAS